MSIWQRWVDRCNRPIDVRPFALTRILLPLAILVDFAEMAMTGMVGTVFELSEYGGIAGFHRAQYWFLHMGPNTGVYLFSIVMVSFAMVVLGIKSRFFTIVGVLAFAQLGHLFPGGDRAVDRLIRTGMLLLVFTDAHRCYSLENVLRKRPRVTHTAGWVEDILRLLMAILYMSAGLAKLGAGDWFALRGPPQLYRVMTDPMAAKLDPLNPTWRTFWPLFRFSGMVTVVWELLSPILLTARAHQYLIVGVVMHLGIAVAMKLGVFSFGVLALYPPLMAPWLLPLLDRVEGRIGVAPPPRT